MASDTDPAPGGDATAGEMTDELETLKARVRELEAENERLWTNTGVGGYAGDAPEEMYVSGLAEHGCDAWIGLVRVQVIGGEVNERQAAKIAEGRYTQPVRYVRADKVDALLAERDALRRAVAVAKPFVEEAVRDASYPPGAVERVLKQLRAALARGAGEHTEGSR